jgi:hypothetical protein
MNEPRKRRPLDSEIKRGYVPQNEPLRISTPTEEPAMAKDTDPANNGEAPPKKRRPRQRRLLDELEPGGIKEIDDAAEEYVEVRDRRMALTTEEAKRKETLMNLMKKHKLTDYEYDSKTVEYIASSKENVKVKTKGSDEEDEDGEDEGAEPATGTRPRRKTAATP